MGGDRQDVLSTYRHLRLAMVLVLGMLLVAVLLRAGTAPGVCFEGSISAYYFTSVRAVFVGSLCALGTCLIVYRGNRDAEDVALNASGALAFVVAFVPTAVPNDMGVACSASNVPGAGQIDVAVNNNMAAYGVTAAVALVLASVVTFRSATAGRAPRVALLVMGAVLLAGIAAYVAWPEGFRERAHSLAALGTFAGILSVVALNALGARERVEGRGSDERFRAAYGLIAAVMLVAGTGLIAAHLAVPGWRHGVLWIEAVLLLLFMAFWMVQTVELWNHTRRDAPPAAPSHPLLSRSAVRSAASPRQNEGG